MFFVLLWPLALLAFLAVWCAAKSAAPALAALKRLDPAVKDRWYLPRTDIPQGNIYGLGADGTAPGGYSTGMINVGNCGMLLSPPYTN